jgi:cytochrome c
MEVKLGRHESVRARVGGPNRPLNAMALAIVLTVGHLAPSFASGDAAHGATIYHECMICHSVDKNGIGPRHRGVFGRKAGSVPDYDYSAALKAADIVWNETAVDQWLTNLQALVPGTKMMFSISNAQDRADVMNFSRKRQEMSRQA